MAAIIGIVGGLSLYLWVAFTSLYILGLINGFLEIAYMDRFIPQKGLQQIKYV